LSILYKISEYFSYLQGNSSRYKLAKLAGFAICIILIALRYPPFILKPRLWAEENLYYELFFSAEKWWHGFDALIYPAYYVGLSRFAGFLASLFDPIYAAVITTYFGFFILLIPFAIIFFGKCSYWNNLEKKAILSLILIFSCSTGEIWLNSTNIHFILPIITFLILIDDHTNNKLKTYFYSIFISFACITGPISLLLSPLFLIRFIQKKEKEFFIYCLCFLIFGFFQVIFFAVSLSLGMVNENRGSAIDLDFFNQLYYLVSPNIIFPLFGYFISLIFRNFMISINSTDDWSNYILIIQEYLPVTLSNIFMSLLSVAQEFSFLLNLIFVFFFIYISFKIIVKSNLEEKLYFIFPFLYLCLVANYFSLSGHGGFRYSFITGFILLFFIFQKIYGKQKKSKTGVAQVLLIISISVGVIEYYPRVISYTPETLSKGETWPLWSEEVKKWEEENKYNPVIWPHLSNNNGLWPDRDTIYKVNLNEPESWNNQGKLRFSSEIKNFFTKSEEKNNK
tara:strand:+ start:30692 stop:32218 length:1527 start_codon:yes stop_codon:yes gene_type:complete